MSKIVRGPTVHFTQDSVCGYIYIYAVSFAEGMLAASESTKRRASKDRWETKGRQNLSARHLSERLFQLKVDDYLT